MSNPVAKLDPMGSCPVLDYRNMPEQLVRYQQHEGRALIISIEVGGAFWVGYFLEGAKVIVIRLCPPIAAAAAGAAAGTFVARNTSVDEKLGEVIAGVSPVRGPNGGLIYPAPFLGPNGGIIYQ
jgi:hypothetical protein